MRKVSSCQNFTAYHPRVENQHIHTMQPQGERSVSSSSAIQKDRLKKVSSCGDLAIRQSVDFPRKQLEAAQIRIQGITERLSNSIKNFDFQLKNHMRFVTQENNSNFKSVSEKLRIIERNFEHQSAICSSLKRMAQDLDQEAENLAKNFLLTKKLESSLKNAYERYEQAIFRSTLLFTLYEEKRYALVSPDDQSSSTQNVTPQPKIDRMIDDLSEQTKFLETTLNACINTYEGRPVNDPFITDACFAADALFSYDHNLERIAKDLKTETEYLQENELLTEQIHTSLDRANKKYVLARYWFDQLSSMHKEALSKPAEPVAIRVDSVDFKENKAIPQSSFRHELYYPRGIPHLGPYFPRPPYPHPYNHPYNYYY